MIKTWKANLFNHSQLRQLLRFVFGQHFLHCEFSIYSLAACIQTCRARAAAADLDTKADAVLEQLSCRVISFMCMLRMS